VIFSLCEYFKHRALVVTDIYRKERTYSLPKETEIHELGLSYQKSKFLPMKIVKVLSDAIKMTSIARKYDVKILYAHKFSSLFRSCVTRFFLAGKIKVCWQIYGWEEVKNPLSILGRLLISLGLINQILVLNDRENRILRQILKNADVFTLRLGVSLDTLKKSERYPAQTVEVPRGLYLKAGDERFVKFYFHGILMPRRRIEDLLEALAFLRQQEPSVYKKVILYISGSPELCERYVHFLMGLIQKLGLMKKVIFLGILTDEELAYMYLHCHIFVWPCVKQSWGLAPLEAMLFREAVIVSSEVGVSEILENGKTALIVPPRDPKSLAVSIATLVKDPHLREELGKRGHDLIMHHFTFAHTGKQLEELWSRI